MPRSGSDTGGTPELSVRGILLNDGGDGSEGRGCFRSAPAGLAGVRVAEEAAPGRRKRRKPNADAGAKKFEKRLRSEEPCPTFAVHPRNEIPRWPARSFPTPCNARRGGARHHRSAPKSRGGRGGF